jgi:hypothetical protein
VTRRLARQFLPEHHPHLRVAELRVFQRFTQKLIPAFRDVSAKGPDVERIACLGRLAIQSDTALGTFTKTFLRDVVEAALTVAIS